MRDGAPGKKTPGETVERADVALASSAAAVTAANQAIAHLAGAVVLVVDDADDNRDLYAQFLTAKGYRVVTAVDGPDALQIAREVKPDAIVLDLGLPIVDGWEVTRLLRAEPFAKDVPIIACSGFAGNDDKERAFAAGVNSYLVKPSSPVVLEAALASSLKSRI